MVYQILSYDPPTDSVDILSMTSKKTSLMQSNSWKKCGAGLATMA